MKNKNIIILVIALIILGFIFFIFSKKDQTSSSGSNVTAPTETRLSEKNSKKVTAKGEEDSIDAKREIFDSLSRKLQKMWIISDSSVFPIKFWGKVIDQYNNPVRDVNILYYAGGGYIGGGSGFGRIKTDENGLFEIKGAKGGSLNLREMKKDGYEIVIKPEENLFHDYKEYPDSLIWTDYTSKNPFVYKAWKYTGKFDKNKMKSSSAHVYCKSGGEECTVDLFGPPTQNSKKDFINSQFIIKYYQEEGKDRKNPGKWKLIITAIDGGVQKAVQHYTSEVPKEEFLDSITYSSDDFAGEQYGYRIRSFYVMNDKIYARFSFKITPYFQDIYCSIISKYTINTAGEPYLDSFNGW